MISPFTSKDVRVILRYLGSLLIFLSFSYLLPAVLAFLFNEKNPFYDFLLAFLITLNTGMLLRGIFRKEKELTWSHSIFLVGLLWLGAMFFSAIPLYLSGHYLSFLDACFETMSGFATTGLTLTYDLETLSLSHNFFRHLSMFLGGQGIVIIALSLLFKPGYASLGMYYAEARQEKILPSIVNTSRFIWKVSIVYLILGVLSLWSILLGEGFPFFRSLIYSFCLFMASFDTGGFVPFTQNISYFHSFYLEIALSLIMILGATNFSLHFFIWQGKRREVFRDIEARTFFLSMFILFLFIANLIPYHKGLRIFREGFFILLSAHTGTGFSTSLSSDYFFHWKPLGLFLIMVAMSLGGGICSTTGGVKLLRIGVIFKSLGLYIRRAVNPPHSRVGTSLHHLKDIPLDEEMVRSSFIISFLYGLSFFLGTALGMFYGYGFMPSLFESISATCNVGLSSGITTVGMPQGLKVIYIFQMWLGRLEFVTIFGIIIYLFHLRGLRK